MKNMKQGWIIEKYIKCHYVNDKLHCDDGPAIICKNGVKYWYKHGLRHREDGPAIESIKYCEANFWYYEGKYIGASYEGFSQEKFEGWLKFRAFL